MSYYIGLDGGSTYLKGALLKGRQVVETMVCSTGIDNNGSAGQMLEQLRKPVSPGAIFAIPWQLDTAERFLR